MAMGASTVSLESAAKIDVEAFIGKWAPRTADNLMAGLDAGVRVADKFILTVEGSYFKDKPYDITSAEGRVSGSFAPHEMILALGGDILATDFLSVEVKAKAFMSTLATDVEGMAFGADLVARYHVNGFNVAAGARNLGSPIRYGNSKDAFPMPMLATVGGSYSGSGLTAAAEVDFLFSGALMAGLGLEYCVQDIVSIRAGYHYGDALKALPSFASLGLGARFSGFKLDLSYLLANRNIGGSILFGLGYSF